MNRVELFDNPLVRTFDRISDGRLFYLFSGYSHYSPGGFSDFIVSHTDIHLLEQCGNYLLVDHNDTDYHPAHAANNWYHIIDIKTMKVIVQKGDQIYFTLKEGLINEQIYKTK